MKKLVIAAVIAAVAFTAPAMAEHNADTKAVVKALKKKVGPFHKKKQYPKFSVSVPLNPGALSIAEVGIAVQQSFPSSRPKISRRDSSHKVYVRINYNGHIIDFVVIENGRKK